MSRSLKRSGVVISQHFVHQDPYSDDPEYPCVGPIVIGAIQIVLGLASIALGIAAICVHASGYYIAYGIWCGVVFIVAGIISIVTGACARNACMITTNMVFGVLSSFLACVQFSLGVVAAANDNLDQNRLDADWIVGGTPVPWPSYGRFDIYYSKLHSYNLCAKSDSGYGVSSWQAVDVLLLLVAFIEGVFALTTAILGCKSICCGVTHAYPVDDEPEPRLFQDGQNGYYNEGYGLGTNTRQPIASYRS